MADDLSTLFNQFDEVYLPVNANVTNPLHNF